MGAAIAICVMLRACTVGWDAQVCWKTIQALHGSNDPYATGLAALQAFHNRSGFSTTLPHVYVYSPMTLPLMRLLGGFPGWVIGLLFGAAVAVGALLQIWAGFQMADKEERRWLAMVLPAVVFFPGLITDDVILSGNVAYILYGVILAAAVPGWKRGSWSWYYIAVLAASIFKAPFLTLLAFPVLVDRRQWFQSGIAAATGALVFAAQIRLLPDMFREYMLTIQLMFDWEHDFGFGPAGVLGKALSSEGLPTSVATTMLYLAFAVGFGIILLWVAYHVRDWNLPRENWIPVALVGTLLLNPRIMKYDLAAITVPMLLIGWRALRFAFVRSTDAQRRCDSEDTGQNRSDRIPILVGSGCFLVSNLITIAGPSWFPIELVMVLAIFSMGIWFNYQSRLEVQALAAPPRTQAEDLLNALMSSSSVKLEP
jgi:hypothetical protein